MIIEVQQQDREIDVVLHSQVSLHPVHLNTSLQQ